MSEQFFALAFGLRWHSDTPLPLFTSALDNEQPADVAVERVASLSPRVGGQPFQNGEIFPDGTRFRCAGAVFDMFDGRLVRWSGPEKLPLAFYGTVAALLLAWRGHIPLHGSAVAMDRGTVLLAGRSGAGKSTLCHALVERGGRLISDDLSVLVPSLDGEVPRLLPGRPAIRLVKHGNMPDPFDKVLVTPPALPQDQSIPLTHLILLQNAPVAAGPADWAAALARQQFRPRWMRQLPDLAARTRHLFLAAQQIAIHTLPPAFATPDQTAAQKAAIVEALLVDSRASPR
jgi:hypothetical protein